MARSSSAMMAARASAASAMALTEIFTTSGSTPPAPIESLPATTAASGTRTTAATSGGRATTCRSRNSITSVSTTTGRITSMAVCRTTARGSATPSIRAASPTAAGRTCTAAMDSGCSSIRPIRTICTPSPRAARSGASTGRPTSRAGSGRCRVTRKRSFASTGTRRSTSVRRRSGRCTSARSFSSAPAISARRGIASRPI